jgi:hypothetical protein
VKPASLACLTLLVLSGCGGNEAAIAPPAASVTQTTAASAPAAAQPLSTSTASKSCTELAAVVRPARLGAGTPSAEVAEKTAESLDSKLSRLTSDVHEPAVELHAHLHDLAKAQRRGRTTRAGELADKARTDARAVAKACGVPEADFLG